MSRIASHPGQRDALDRLLLRVPSLVTSLASGLNRVPSGTTLRRRLVHAQVKRGFGAMARSDVDLVVRFYEPDAEVWMRSMAGVGMRECYRGRDGIRELYADIDEAFDDWHWTLRGVTDGGDKMAIRCDFVGYGRASGVKTELIDGGTAIRLSPRRLATWQEWFVENGGWWKALEALGLRPDERRPTAPA